MIELSPYLKKLISLPGLSGFEAPVHDLIRETWSPIVDEMITSPLGSLHGLKCGTGSEPRPRLLLAAHMDAIGLMVTTIANGFLRITEVGGVDPRILPGQPVIVHGKKDLPGVIIQPPSALLPPGHGEKPVEMRYLFVDTGMTEKEVNELVHPGDQVSFAQVPVDLTGECMAGHTMDDRVAVAAVTLCLQDLQHIQHTWDVWAVATVQEEETFGGAWTSAFSIQPQLAVAIDVTFAKGPGLSNYRGYPLGKGLTLAMGPNIHPAVFKRFKEVAEKLDIPFHTEPNPTHTGTDSFAMQVTAEGIPCMVIGIPLRYMHTPVETVCLKDISRTGHLLTEFIATLEPDFVSKITWDD